MVIWRRTYVKGPFRWWEETRCHHMGYSFRLAARVLLYAPSHRQDRTYHSLCFTSCGALAGTRNSSVGPPWRIDPMTHRTINECSYHSYISLQDTWSLWLHWMCCADNSRDRSSGICPDSWMVTLAPSGYHGTFVHTSNQGHPVTQHIHMRAKTHTYTYNHTHRYRWDQSRSVSHFLFHKNNLYTITTMEKNVLSAALNK